MRARTPRASSDTALRHQFDRCEWPSLGAGEQLDFSQCERAPLPSVNESLSPGEVLQPFGHLSHLLRQHMVAARNFRQAVEAQFLRSAARPPPYVIAIAGGVAAGKSTLAHSLRTVISHWPEQPDVALVPTDGFLFPSAVLERNGLMARKGFPETYNLARMMRFLVELKSNKPDLQVPIYSHERYDIVANERQIVSRPDIVILEGLNVLQPVPHGGAVASDFLDFSIYLDADPTDMEEWYVERFLILRRLASQKPKAYSHRDRELSTAEIMAMARAVWQRTNLPNLMKHIQPTRARADLVICKGRSHRIEELWLRRT